MQGSIAKWGNSLALRLPKQLAASAKLFEGTQVELKVEGDSLVVRSVRPKYKLADLLEQVKQGDRETETDWGTAKGEEAW